MTTKQAYFSSFLKISVSFLICLFSFSQLYAQKKGDYTLLWEITGNGLSKPSYLFGTINFKDKRAFNFSDSVYIAIANTSGFATETHIDSTVKALLFKENEPPKAAAAHADDNPPKMAAQHDSDIVPNAFLYGLARTYRKKIYGLEDKTVAALLNTAESETETLTEEEEAMQQEEIDRLIALYQKGNLANLWAEVQQYYNDYETGDRNIAITNQLIKLLKTESVFATVSIALMVGDKGAIAILQKAGYQVRAVGAPFTELAKNYQVDYSKMDWFTHNDDKHNYSVKFPSVPYLTSNKGTSRIMNYYDPIKNVGYTSTSLYTGTLMNMTAAQYADTVLAKYVRSSGSKLVSSKIINKFGATILEATLAREGKHSKTRIMHINGTFYSMTVEHEKDILADNFTSIFFDSFEVHEPKAISADNWVQHQNTTGAFSAKFPVTPDEVVREVPNPLLATSPYILYMTTATDKVSGINYIIRYNDFPKGMYLVDKQAVFETTIKDFEKKGKIIGTPVVVFNDGYEGRKIDLVLENMLMEVILYVKGNRTYMLLRQNMNGTDKIKDNQFFDSFKFIANSPSKEEAFTLGNVQLSMPGKPILVTSTEDEKKGESFVGDDQTYYALNANTGGVYGIEQSKVSKYYRHKNIDTLYQQFANTMAKSSGTPAITTNFTLKNLKGIEISTTDSVAGTSKKRRIWFDGDHIYILTVIGSKNEVEGEQANSFFNSVKLAQTQPLFNFQSSKAKLIMEDLSSKQLATQELALGAFSFYEFEKDELPIIHTAIQQKYTNDTSTVGTRVKLLDMLVKLKNEQTATLLKKVYADSKGLDLIQSKVLSVLPYVDSTSYDWYFKTLTEAPVFAIENYWELFDPLSDSLSYAAANIDKVLKLSKESNYRPMVLSVFSTMLATQNIATYQTLLNSKKELITENAMKDLALDFDRIKDGKYALTLNYYLAILPKLSVQGLTDDFTKKVIALDTIPYLITNAVAARISANLPVDKNLLTAQLDSLSTRYSIMYAYEKAGKINEVPLKYREHSEFAKLLMYDYLSEEYDYPQELKLLGKIKEEKATYYAFEFTFTEENEKKTYVGICGPFDEQPDRLDFEKYLSYSKFEAKEKDWLKQAKALIAAMNEE